MTRPTRWYCNQRIRHTGSLDLGNVIAIDFEEDLVQISDGRWWRMEHVIDVASSATERCRRVVMTETGANDTSIGVAADERYAPCGAQDWAYDDDDEPFIYGTCELPAGHDGYWHQQRTPSGKVWAEWRGPTDERAPAGARDGFLGGGPHDGT